MRITLRQHDRALAVSAELALTSDDRARGRAFRAALPPASGMLFVFAEPTSGPFTFADNYSPTDLVLIDAGAIVAAHHDLPALHAALITLEPAVRYVLELPGGTLRDAGLDVGATVELDPADLAPDAPLAAHRPLVVLVDVDGVGTHLVDELHRRGHATILVDTAAEHVRHRRYPDESDHVATFRHAGDAARVAALLAPWRPAAVVAGSEEGVSFADALAAELGLPCNLPELRAPRRDKFLMVEAVRAAGLPAPRQLRASDAATINAWRRQEGLGEIIVKPSNSAGSDGVRACRSEADVEAAVDANVGRENRLGLPIDAVTAQERLRGAEYYVNAATRDGVHHVTDVWLCAKRAGDDTEFVYDYFELVLPGDPHVAEVTAYVTAALTALGVRWGPSHTEVIVTDDGPRLIDFGARTDGTYHATLCRYLTGTSVVDLALDALLAPEAWRAKTWQAYAPRGRARSSCLVFDRPGIVRAVPALELLPRLSTYFDLRMYPVLGLRAQPTRDAFTYPGILWLVALERQRLAADHATLRALEAQGLLFGIESDLDLPDPGSVRGRLHTRELLAASPRWAEARLSQGAHIVLRDEVGLVVTERATLEARVEHTTRLLLGPLRDLERDRAELVIAPPVACDVVAADGSATLVGYDPHAHDAWLATMARLGLAPTGEHGAYLGVVDLARPRPGPLPGAPDAVFTAFGALPGGLAQELAALAEGPLPFVAALLAASSGAGGAAHVRDSDGLAGALVVVFHDRVAHVVHAALRPSGDVLGRVDALLLAAMTAARDAACDLFSVGAVVDPRCPEDTAERQVYTDICARFAPVGVALPPPLRLAPDAEVWALGGPPDPASRLADSPDAARLRDRAIERPHPFQDPYYVSLLQQVGWGTFVAGGTTFYTQELAEGRFGWVQLPPVLDLEVLLDVMGHMGVGRVGIELLGRTRLIDRSGRPHDLDYDPWAPEPWLAAIRDAGLRFHRRHYMFRKTFLLDLSDGRDGMLRRCKESARKAFRRAHSRGLVYEEHAFPRAGEPLYDEVKEVHDRWRAGSGYEGEWYIVEPMMRYFRGDARLVVARLDGAIVGAQFVLVRPPTVFGYYQFVLREAMPTHASTGLVFETARIGEERGCDLFDIMGTWDERFPEDRPEWRGFTAFKAQLNPVPLYYPPTVICDLARYR